MDNVEKRYRIILERYLNDDEFSDKQKKSFKDIAKILKGVNIKMDDRQVASHFDRDDMHQSGEDFMDFLDDIEKFYKCRDVVSKIVKELGK